MFRISFFFAVVVDADFELGVWFGASPLVPHALVMDLEGTDSVTRGQERHPFERQSALLALSVAEVLIINMWQHDIGRYVASNYGVR